MSLAPTASQTFASLALNPIPFVRGLAQLVPERRLSAILTRTGRASERLRSLPAESVIWLVIAMTLFAADSIPKVWRRLHPTRDDPEPTDAAFTQARQRLGVAPLRQLFLETARPMATHQTVGAFYRGWRLMGLDGTVLDLPDTPTNARTFGRPTTGRAEGAFPQVRLLALCELGTHAICGLAIKPLCHGEPSMVGSLLDQLGPGMLLIWDRGFFSYELVRSVCQQGAHLLARVKSNTILKPLRRLSDGSYLAKIYPNAGDRRHDRRGLLVRVIEYTHDDPQRPGAGERHRLITDLLNPSDLPAHEAPLVYHERWEEELAFDEIKTHLSGRAVPIRSKTPAGVVQEIYGMILAHYVVRRVMHDASVVSCQDPDRLSFTDSLRILQCQLPEAPHHGIETWYQRLIGEVRRQKLRPRRDRWYPRVIKRKMSNWGKKRPKHRRPPQPTKPFWKSVVILN
jgi:Insertion element 4 transposase N-terminal/Transposase DDE domain